MINVIHQGLGPIGKGIAKLVLDDPEMRIVGAIDINPDFIGKDLGDILGVDALGVVVRDDAEAVLDEVSADVLVLATCSKLSDLLPSLKLAMTKKVNIVSPSEELFFPSFVSAEIASELDKMAKDNAVRVLGGAVNPGCLMDSFPLHLFKQNIDTLKSMTVFRWDDTTERRVPLLKKTGAGLSVEEFADLDSKGKLGHVGLKMSAAYIAEGVGLSNYDIAFKREPMIASSAVKPLLGDEIPAGKVTGLHETCSVIVDGEKKIVLDLRMFVGAENKNGVELSGLKEKVPHSKSFFYNDIVNGDIATMRIVKDMITHAVSGEAGLNSVEYVPDPTVLLKK